MIFNTPELTIAGRYSVFVFVLICLFALHKWLNAVKLVFLPTPLRDSNVLKTKIYCL